MMMMRMDGFWFDFVLDLRKKSWYLLDLYFGRKKNLENVDIDMRRKKNKEDDESEKTRC